MDERFKNWKPPVFNDDGWAYPDWNCMNHKENKYGWRCQHPELLELGKKVDIGCGTYMNARYKIMLGDNVQIGANCSIYSVDTIDDISGHVILNKNCKIGANTVILPGCVVGENSIIGAGSVVPSYHKIPKNEVWVGVPIKFKKVVKLDD